MNKWDIIFSALCGVAIAWIADDFINGLGFHGWKRIIFYIFMPIITIFCLWMSERLGKKHIFIFQAAKFCLAGGFADVMDVKAFQFSVVALALFSITSPTASKIISFLSGTVVKYWLDKKWTFQKHGKEKIRKEMFMFFIVAVVGLVINILAFWYFMRFPSPTFITMKLWTELAVIFAALASAVWNFCGYKFIVFKK